MADLTGQMLGQYKIIERLGRGATSTVYKAYQEKLDRFVAIKVLSPHFIDEEGFLDRFHQEARAVARLDHPNILPVYDFDRIDDTVFIVMKYVTTGTLRDLMASPMDFNTIQEIGTQVGLALGYAHRQGVVHRDVKPGNILIADNNWALLTDFGLSKLTAISRHLTRSGMGVGTPDYMSPEQAQGRAVDGRSDLYSLGVMLYEMAAGRLPFDADSGLGVVVKHITEEAPPLRELRSDASPALEHVIRKAMSKEPADRYVSAEMMVAALVRAINAPSAAPIVNRPMGHAEPIEPETPPTPRAVPRVPWTVYRQRLVDHSRALWMRLKSKFAAMPSERRQALAVSTGIVALIVALFLLSPSIQPRSAVTLTPTPTQSATKIAALPATSAPIATLAATPVLTPTLDDDVIATEDAAAQPSPAPAPAGMVLVRAGTFVMGGVKGKYDVDETPPHSVRLEAFFIDVREVTNERFAAFVAASGYQTDAEKVGDETTWRKFNTSDRQRFPVTYVSWNDATRYCAWMGKRLPTEAEWEKAARGTTKNVYPWGDEFNSAIANTLETGAGQPVAVGSYLAVGPYGTFDMIGNVWEWVQDWYGGYSASAQVDPSGPATGVEKVIRGGSFKTQASRATTSVRGQAAIDGHGDDIGFRCAK